MATTSQGIPNSWTSDHQAPMTQKNFAELFNFEHGKEWGVSRYLFQKWAAE